MLKNQKGFTLIELLIVVVIIGILAAIALPKFSAARDRAYYSAMKSDLKSLASAQEIYYSKNLAYTSTAADLGFQASQDVTVTLAAVPNTAGAVNQAFTGGATHAAIGTAGCAIYAGELAAGYTANGATATKQGVPACDETP